MKIKDGFLKRKIGEKFLVVSTNKVNGGSMFIELNETSSDIWDCVSKGLSKEETADVLCKKYGIDHAKAQSDVDKIISQMLEAGVIEN